MRTKPSCRFRPSRLEGRGLCRKGGMLRDSKRRGWRADCIVHPQTIILIIHRSRGSGSGPPRFLRPTYPTGGWLLGEISRSGARSLYRFSRAIAEKSFVANDGNSMALFSLFPMLSIAGSCVPCRSPLGPRFSRASLLPCILACRCACGNTYVVLSLQIVR